MSRSNWKINSIDTNLLNTTKKITKIYKRNLVITPEYINKTVSIYNGKRFFDINITKKMVGHKFGEFSSSRIKPIHKTKK